MARGNGSRLRRNAERQGVSVYVAKALRTGINPNAHNVNGAVNIALAGLWRDREGFLHCTRRRQYTRIPLKKQLNKLIRFSIIIKHSTSS